ncbi:MAG TPA: hypothetical protein VGB59_09315 [Allosphingosinicella sp.]|jgi:hypothetical protein
MIATPQPAVDMDELVRLQAGVLPSLALALDTLLESAMLARPGTDADTYAAQLRELGAQLGDLTVQLEELGGAGYAAPETVAA